MKIDLGSRVLAVEKEGNTVAVRFRRYPDYPNGNYVDEVVRVDTVSKVVEMYRVRNGWNGTGRDDYGKMALSGDELDKLLNVINNIKSVDDFSMLVDMFNSMLSERVKKIDAMIEKLARNLQRYKRAIDIFESLCVDVCKKASI